MLRRASRSLLRGVLTQVGRVPLTRRALHGLAVASRGQSVAFLRCRRLVDDSGAHDDAMTAHALHKELVAAQRFLTFVHAREAVALLSRGDRLDKALAVLTFDESFADTAERALPICDALGVPFLMFVTTGHLSDGRTLWDEEVRAVVERMAPRPLTVSWIDRVLRTDSAAERLASVRGLLVSLASLDDERLRARLQELFAKTGGPPATARAARMLDTAMLERLARHPLVAFGAHGHAHYALAALSDDRLAAELAVPRQLLLERCGAAFADIVSYPFGRPPYVDDRVVRAARAAGYQAGMTAVSGVARPSDHLFRLPRLPIGPGTPGVAAVELAGSLDAVDELVRVVTGEPDRLHDALDG